MFLCMGLILHTYLYTRTMLSLVHLSIYLAQSAHYASGLAIAPVNSLAQTHNSTRVVLPGHKNAELTTFAPIDYGTHLPVANVRNAWKKISRDPSPLMFSYRADADVRLGKIIYDGMSQ